jgi:hypothetical protein
MPSTPLALATRIERAEARLVADIARNVAAREPERDVLALELGAGVAVFAGADSPLSKWIGIGLPGTHGGALDEARVARLEDEVARRGGSVRVELCELADPRVAELFERRGYRCIGEELVLALALDAAGLARLEREAPARPAELAVLRVERGDAAHWLDVVVTGFLHPDGSAATPPTESFSREAMERAFLDTLSVPGFELFLARRGGEPAGGGGLRRFEGIAQLCGASTLPGHRRRGVQSALLAARLRSAAEGGCDLAVVTTEPESKSQRNAQARGFERLYARRVLVAS